MKPVSDSDMETALHWGFVCYSLCTVATATIDQISVKKFTPFIVVLVKNDVTNNKGLLYGGPFLRLLLKKIVVCDVHQKCSSNHAILTRKAEIRETTGGLIQKPNSHHSYLEMMKKTPWQNIIIIRKRKHRFLYIPGPCPSCRAKLVTWVRRSVCVVVNFHIQVEESYTTFWGRSRKCCR